MLWILFTLLSVVLWSSGNIIDKAIMTKLPNSPFAYYMIAVVYQSLYILLAFLILQPTFILNQFVLSVLSGLLGNGAFLALIISLQKEEVSRVIPLTYLSNVFIVLFSHARARERDLFEGVEFLKGVLHDSSEVKVMFSKNL